MEERFIMSHQKMQVVHQLIEEGRYREARGILETEEDLDPEVVQKWTAWLDELHREERALAGIMVSEKKARPHKAFTDTVTAITIPMFLMPLAVLTWIYCYETFRAPTSHGFFVLLGLVVGMIGWQWLARMVLPSNGVAAGGFVAIVLITIFLSSGVFWYYYPDPPMFYVMAAFALFLPGVIFVSYRLGDFVGRVIAALLRLLLTPQKFTK